MSTREQNEKPFFSLGLFPPLADPHKEKNGKKRNSGQPARKKRLVGRYFLNDEKRADWDVYFMEIAHRVATRATCDRKHVGSLIVRNKTILSTGYNGSIRGMAHCDGVGHLMEGGHCVRTTHAEANAIIQATRNGVKIEDSEIYITASPCWNCFKLIANAGIICIKYGEFYRDERILGAAKELGLELRLIGV